MPGILAKALVFVASGACVLAPRTASVAKPPLTLAGWAGSDADTDGDGLPDTVDPCPAVVYAPGFQSQRCGPMDLNPDNDALPECKARERVARLLFTSGVFVTNIAFSVVRNGDVHFADAFKYTGGGQYQHDPAGIHRLYRVGSTTKPMVSVAAMIMQEQGRLSLSDFVNDADGTRRTSGGQRTLRHLLSHDGAFKVDNGAIHLFCYDGNLAAFWADPDDLVSPRFTSSVYGNLGGGFQYSAFNYSLAGTYLAHAAGTSFAATLQARVFDPARMCTASFDGTRATLSAIGREPGVSQAPVMHVGPYINLVSPTDPRCIDNFYSSEDLPGDPYSWQVYHIDEAAAEARDPAGGAIASVIDLGRFAGALLDCYHGRPGAILSQQGVRDLWRAHADLGCGSGCPYERYYGLGFFTSSVTGQVVTQVEHGGSRPGFASAFVIRPEADAAVVILANADVSTVTLSNLAKTILNDFGN